jgi:hypothetical protein
MTLFGWLIGRREVLDGTGGFWARLFYGAFFVGSFNWFWYGDMPFIRVLMAAAVVGGGYRALLGVTSPPSSVGSAVSPALPG